MTVTLETLHPVDRFAALAGELPQVHKALVALYRSGVEPGSVEAIELENAEWELRCELLSLFHGLSSEGEAFL